MGQSIDLSWRLLSAIDDGMSCHAAAARFGAAPSTAIRWQAQRRETSNCTPKPQDGDMRSRRVEERRADILAVWEARKDFSLEELRLALIEIGLNVSVDVAREDRSGRRRSAVSPALQPRLQSHRKCFCPPQGHTQKNRRAIREQPLGPHRQTRRHL